MDDVIISLIALFHDHVREVSGAPSPLRVLTGCYATLRKEIQMRIKYT